MMKGSFRSELLQIYQSESEIINSHTGIAIYPLTPENTDTKFYIINLPDFVNDSKIRHISYMGIVIMYSSKVLDSALKLMSLFCIILLPSCDFV